MSSTFHKSKPLVLYENRYCNQEDFDIVVCGGENKNSVTNEVTELKGPCFENSKTLRPMKTKRSSSKTAVVGSDIYVLGGYVGNVNWTSSFEVYSARSKHWKKLEPIHEKLKYYCACSFMKSIYVIGGSGNKKDCYKFETTKNKWSKISELRKQRFSPSCTVFDGKIIVTGGFNTGRRLRSVESFDHHENKWTFLCDMIDAKALHSSVSMGNKMFVIDRFLSSSFEVYESVSRKFSFLNIIPLSGHPRNFYYRALSVGNKLFILSAKKPCSNLEIYAYNVDNNKWISEDSLFETNLFCCVFEKHSKI